MRGCYSWNRIIVFHRFCQKDQILKQLFLWATFILSDPLKNQFWVLGSIGNGEGDEHSEAEAKPAATIEGLAAQASPRVSQH